MTPRKIFEMARSGLSRRLDRAVEPVNAVFDDDLWEILESLELLEKLDSGQLRCAETGVVLTRDNLGSLRVTPAGVILLAETAVP